jgi:hypothetical protein
MKPEDLEKHGNDTPVRCPQRFEITSDREKGWNAARCNNCNAIDPIMTVERWIVCGNCGEKLPWRVVPADNA